MASMLGINHEIHFIHTWNGESLPQGGESEVSWLAMPHTRLFNRYPDIKIIHLVRHPYNVIASIEGQNFWEQSSGYLSYVLKYLPGLENIKGRFQKSLYYWLHWNQLLLKEYPRIAIESITTAIVLNRSSGKSLYNLDWKTIENNQLKRDVESLAESYGYGFNKNEKTRGFEDSPSNTGKN